MFFFIKLKENVPKVLQTWHIHRKNIPNGCINLQPFWSTGTCLFIIRFKFVVIFWARLSRKNYKSFETWLQTSKTSILMHLQICNLIRDAELYAICKNVIFLFFHLQENCKSSANRGDNLYENFTLRSHF